ncbi:hypothetical protein M0R45_035325 [Rubus argutus]|uniref:Receptor ligand binding region domain-containing protein n=1 Tax=Rubus argutus TaxID=59490 RepID=A0AAW1VVA2_RUBAR
MSADEAAEIKGISALIEVFKWRDVILLYDNKDYERDFIPSLVNSFQENTHGSVAYKNSNIASSSSNEEIIEELQKLIKLKIKVFVVHVSHFLAPRLFLSANKLGMMGEGINEPSQSYFKIEEEVYLQDPNMEAIRELSTDGIRAYDATWALAEAAERARLKNSMTRSSKGVVLPKDLPAK